MRDAWDALRPLGWVGMGIRVAESHVHLPHDLVEALLFAVAAGELVDRPQTAHGSWRLALGEIQ